MRGNEKFGFSFALISNLDCAEYPEASQSPLKGRLDQMGALLETIEITKEHIDSFRCLAWCNPHHESCDEEFQKVILSSPLVVGLKFHPWVSQLRIDDEKYRPYLQFADRASLPCLFHTAYDGFSNIAYLEKWLIAFPNVKFVAAHMELYSPNNGETALELMRKYPNLYIDSAWVPANQIARVLREIGGDRALFGSDSPIDGEDTLDNVLYREYESALSDEEKENFFLNNGRKVYKLPV